MSNSDFINKAKLALSEYAKERLLDTPLGFYSIDYLQTEKVFVLSGFKFDTEGFQVPLFYISKTEQEMRAVLKGSLI